MNLCITVLTSMFMLLMTNVSFVNAQNVEGVIWGVVGHNDRPKDPLYPYNKISLGQQILLMRQAGLSAYRSGCDDSTCPALIELLGINDMVFLRSIELRPSERLTADENYERGFNYALAEAKKYSGRIRYYGISNELDNWTKMIGDGSTILQYDPIRYPKARSFIRGLIDGVRKGDQQAKVLVNNAGWCHYGFLRALWNDGIRWDITALHFYSDHGDIEKVKCGGANIAAIHTEFGKPVWITEYNKKSSKTEDNQHEAAKWVETFIRRVKEVAPKYNIEAAFVYELFDEPELKNGEQFYGIVDKDGFPKETYKRIQNELHPANSQNR